MSVLTARRALLAAALSLLVSLPAVAPAQGAADATAARPAADAGAAAAPAPAAGAPTGAAPSAGPRPATVHVTAAFADCSAATVEGAAAGTPAGAERVDAGAAPAAPDPAAARSVPLEVWVDVRTAEGESVPGLAATAFRVELAGQLLEPLTVTPAAAHPGGTAYALLVDVSRSMAVRRALHGTDRDPFAATLRAARALVDRLGPDDRMLVLAVGDGVRVVQEATADKAALVAALDGLKPEAGKTHLFAAIVRAWELLGNTAPTFPRRRVVIAVTDGQDDGSQMGLDRVFAEATRPWWPIAAIGFAKAGRGDFATLTAMARDSDGMFSESPGPQAIDATFGRLAERVRQGYVLRAALPVAPGMDAGRLRADLHVSVSLGDWGGEDARRALPLGDPAGCLPPTAAPAATDAAPAAADAVPGDQAPGWVWPSAIGAVLLLLVAVFVVPRLRPRPAPVVRAADDPPDDGRDRDADDRAVSGGGGGGERGGRAAADEGRSGTTPRRAQAEPAPAEGVTITLRVKEGKGQLPAGAKEFRVPAAGATIGREGTIRVTGDASISRQHCRLTARGGKVLVEDLGSREGTRRNGQAVSRGEVLADGDVLCLGNTHLRIGLGGRS